MPMKKLYLPCWLFIVCSIALVPAASAADAETPAPGGVGAGGPKELLASGNRQGHAH